MRFFLVFVLALVVFARESRLSSILARLEEEWLAKETEVGFYPSGGSSQGKASPPPGGSSVALNSMDEACQRIKKQKYKKDMKSESWSKRRVTNSWDFDFKLGFLRTFC